MMKSKLILTLMFLVMTGAGLTRAQVPDWVKTHPTSTDTYYGVGMAQVTDKDYLQVATTNALADIVRQINVKVENSSFLHTVDVDGKSREMFEEQIRDSQGAWLEGQELKDSYTAGGKYYVLYTLDKKTYSRNSALLRQRAVARGLDYLDKGQEAEAQMNLTQAVKLYGQGLEAVQPYLFYDLTTRRNNRTIDVPTELYNAYLGVFSGMSITTNVTNLTGETFKPLAEVIAGCLSKGGVTIPNVLLKAEFTVGSGTLTPPVRTDYDGTAEFHITAITSKAQVQELRITIDSTFISDLPVAYRDLLGTNTWPEAKVTITLAAAPLTAYVYQTDDNDMPECSRQVSKILADNYFTVTEDPDAADCFVELYTIIDVGGLVTGGITDLNECLCSLRVKIYNNKTHVQLLDYSSGQIKVFSPVNKTLQQTTSMCTREVMKRANVELPPAIKKININQ